MEGPKSEIKDLEEILSEAEERTIEITQSEQQS